MSIPRVFAVTGLLSAAFVVGWRAGIPSRVSHNTAMAMSLSQAEVLGLPADTVVTLESWRTVEELDQKIARFETVFWEPLDTVSLRKLIREPSAVRDKTVLEIGTGTGLISICCLKAGARQVVATDVNPVAVANAAYNGEMFGVRDRLETRLVPLQRPDAYSVVGPSEQFDLVISNPPWEDKKPKAIGEFALYDEHFGLLRSLLENLDKHLAPGGRALLAYGCVEAVRQVQHLAPQYGLEARVLDERNVDELARVFLPGMLIEVRPAESNPKTARQRNGPSNREPIPVDR